MTTATVAHPTQRQTPQWVRALTYLLSAYVYMLTLWLWAIALPVVAAIIFIISRNVEQVTSSGVAFTHHGALWFPFSIAIILAVSYLPVHVANGMTRRSFARAALAVNLIVGAFNALVTILALVAERAIYDSQGWVQGGNDGEGVPVLDGGVLPYAFGLFLIFTAGQISGSLVGIAYYRLGGIGGTLALPLTLLPLAAVGFLGLTTSLQWVPWGVTLNESWGPYLAVAVLVAAAVVFARLVRDIPIDTKAA